MDEREYNQEIRHLYEIAKANGDAATGLKLLMLRIESRERKRKRPDYLPLTEAEVEKRRV